jgi:hypothetical protein
MGITHNEYLNLANELTNWSYLAFNWQESIEIMYEKIKHQAELYYEHTHDKVLCFACEKHEHIMKVFYTTRFSTRYAIRVYKKLSEIKNMLDYVESALFLTLTVDPTKFTNYKQMNKYLSQAFNKLMTNLRKQYKDIAYIKTKEYTKNHIPHLHILLFNVDRIDINYIRKLWHGKYGLGQIMRIEEVKNVYTITKEQVIKKGVFDYIIKYVSKHLSKRKDQFQDILDNDNLILNWATLSRAFSISQNILYLTKRKRLTQTDQTIPEELKHQWQLLAILPSTENIRDYRELIRYLNELNN